MLALFLLAIVTVILLYTLFINKIKGLPPGPPPLPLIGNMHQLKDGSIKTWKKKYGPVFTAWLPNPTVVLCTNQTIQEALVTQGEAFAGRPQNYEVMKLLLGGNYGIIFEDNAMWKEQRRFALHSLRDLGFRSEGLQDTVNTLAVEMVERMKEVEGEEVEIRPFLMFGVANVIWQLTFGRMLKFGDPLLNTVLTHLDEYMSLLVHPTALLIEIHPSLSLLDPLFGGSLKRLVTVNDKILELMNKEIVEVEISVELDSPARCYVEAFMQEMKTNEKEGENPGNFTRHQMLAAASDILSAGFETTVSTLRYAIFHLMSHPEAQKKMQEEIDREIGSRAIRMDDQKVLPYCCSVIQEVQRVAALGSPSRCTVAEATVGGFNIPVGTEILPATNLVHLDEEEYERPKYFCPERHLNDKDQFVKDSRVMPFSVGKRACLGESLARMEIFMFLITLIQKFTFKFPGLIPPELKERESFIKAPEPFKVIFTQRKQI